MKKICLLFTFLSTLFTASFASAQVDEVTVTAPPYSGGQVTTGVYNDNTTDSSNQYAVAYGRAMQAGYAQKAAEEAKKKEEEKKKCKQMLLDIDAVQLSCRELYAYNFSVNVKTCPVIKLSGNIGASGNGLNSGINFAYEPNCEGRFTADMNAGMAGCDGSAARSRAAVGSCE